MNIESPVAINDHVFIPAIESPGIVRAIRVDMCGLTVLVTYWHDGNQKEVWLSPSEIEKK